MKEKFKYILTILITLIIGIIATLITLNFCGVFNKKNTTVEKTVSNITLNESDTIAPAVDKIYNSVVYIESYNNNKTIGSGSGFVYKKDDKYGYILTNYHVIENATKVEITNIEGKSIEATVLGGDEYTDIAVLKIDVSGVLLVAELGSSENSKIGDTIFTVGSPMGKTYIGSVTKGILSGKDRSVTVSSQYVMEVLQLDAAINPGNSGGPLVNINGEVIGITSMKLIEDEIEGMGFAIPIELINSILEKLENGKTIDRPMLGVSMLDINSVYALYSYGVSIDSSIKSGVVVIEVAKNSPAAKAGFAKGDVLLSINGEDIKNVAYFRALLYKYSVGDTITIKYIRDNVLKEVKVNLNVSLENS